MIAGADEEADCTRKFKTFKVEDTASIGNDSMISLGSICLFFSCFEWWRKIHLAKCYTLRMGFWCCYSSSSSSIVGT